MKTESIITEKDKKEIRFRDGVMTDMLALLGIWRTSMKPDAYKADLLYQYFRNNSVSALDEIYQFISLEKVIHEIDPEKEYTVMDKSGEVYQSEGEYLINCKYPMKVLWTAKFNQENKF